MHDAVEYEDVSWSAERS